LEARAAQCAQRQPASPAPPLVPAVPVRGQHRPADESGHDVGYVHGTARTGGRAEDAVSILDEPRGQAGRMMDPNRKPLRAANAPRTSGGEVAMPADVALLADARVRVQRVLLVRSKTRSCGACRHSHS
jgi:hypothetical protein